MKPVNGTVPQPGRDGRLPSFITINVASMDDAEVEDALDIADLSEWTAAASHVNLSLSKKGRWKAVESLKTDLKNGVFREEDYSVYVIERCWLNRQSNCEEITSSKGEITNYYGSSNLFNADTLLSKPKNKPKNKSKTNKDKKKVSGESPTPSEELPTIPELRVEIVRPYERWIPGTSATSRRRRERIQQKKERPTKFRPSPLSTASTNQEDQEDDDWAPTPNPDDVPNDQSPNHGSSKKKRSVSKSDKKPPKPEPKTLPTLGLDLDLGFVSPGENIYEDEDEDEEEDSDYKGVMILEDYLVKESRTKVKEHKECAKRKPSLTKNHIRYIDEIEFAKFASGKEKTEVLPTGADDTTNVVSSASEGGSSGEDVNNNVKKDPKYDIIVTLDKSDVTPDILADTFSERYIECGCYPRRFLLDMTGAVREVPQWWLTPKTLRFTGRDFKRKGKRQRQGRGLKRTTHYNRTQKPVTSSGFLLFEEEHDGKFRVRLETDAEVDVTLWTSELEASATWSPQSLADTVCDFLNKHETSTKLKRLDVSKPLETQSIKLNTLKNILEWPDAESYYSKPFPVSKNKLERPVAVRNIESDECCSICYDVIDISSRDSRGLSLTSCGHWFCNVCWKSHVATNVESGAVNITCPEFKCETRVDEGTMASLLTLRQLKMYKSRLDDMEIQTSDSKLWCPKPGCGRIVAVREGPSSTGCVHCECGTTFCVQCRCHPHWPADCSHLRAYEKDLKRFGDDSVFSWTSESARVVKGKKCPECQSFIEKNMGCPNMVCRCGYSFCWQCLKPWDRHHYNPECYGKSDNHGTEHLQDVYIEDMSQRPQSRTRAYVLALTSRHKQQHRQRKTLGSHVTKMKGELKALVFKHKLLEAGLKKTAAKKENWCRDVEQLRQILEETETREGKHLLDWVLDLIFEIHHVIEYSAVLIGHHKKDTRLSNAGSLVQTLMFLVSRMEMVFQEGVHQKMTKVPVKLARNANMALKILSELRSLKPHLPAISSTDGQEVTS